MPAEAISSGRRLGWGVSFAHPESSFNLIIVTSIFTHIADQ
jgi:hypothetical protein